jgi:APA family basic amino acid/polyamine antiporter
MRRKRLMKSIGFLDSLNLGLSLIIGSSIFIFPLIISSKTGTVSLLGWFLGALYSFIIGIILSELALKYPKEGGIYEFAHKAFGDRAGFAFGTILWISYTSSITVEILILKLILDSVIPSISMAVAIATLLFLTFINLLGLKLSSRIEDTLTFTKLFIIILFLFFAFQKFNPSNLQPLSPNKPLLSLILCSAMLSMYSYTGFEVITLPEEEIKNARKIIRKALLASIFISSIIFILSNLAILGLDNWQNFSKYSTLIDLSSVNLSKEISTLILIASLISLAAAMNALIIGSSRVVYAMSSDNIFFPFFDHLNNKGVPDYALLVQAVVSLSLLIFSLEPMINFAIATTLLSYMLSSLSALKLLPKTRFIEARILPIIAATISLLLLYAAL